MHVLEFPAVCREEEVDGLVAELISALQILVNDAPDGRSSFREFDKVDGLIEDATDVLQNHGALGRFPASITAFKGDQETTLCGFHN